MVVQDETKSAGYVNAYKTKGIAAWFPRGA